ncbi:MAG: asparagine synthase (glutamine-hydrolyzing) [Candidatus Omnitrophica bacterium]|nr:asparagine synthase (glutamine-hydrolyzing) [Candidatus Omnitrophota bacterium]
MCGIVGIASPRPIEERTILSCLRSIQHRGPDDEGVYLAPDRRLALGHRRLSVIDLSSAGRQPMTNEEGTLWITYNGEIYNHPELRRELLAKGHRFKSKTDTEVILHLYEEEGEAVVQRLVGMFAFAIYDQPRERLFLARDRLGIKPLYYADFQGSFLFASEIKGILAAEAVPVEVDWQAIRDYFTFLFVPHPQTAFQFIRELPPATTLLYDLTRREFALERYWIPWSREVGLSAGGLGHEGLKGRLRELLTDSVKGELVSDVPLGVFFSGGIDSTLLAALAARQSHGRVKTFTVGFRGLETDPRDDLAYARLASRALGTDHHELIVDLPDLEGFLGMVRHFDQPFANPTFYIQHLIARETRDFVTVALSGVGGDELFGGYPKYRLFPWARLLRCLPAGPAHWAHRWLGRVKEESWAPVLRRVKRVLRGVGQDLPDQYLRWSYYFTETEKQQLLQGPLSSRPLRPASRHLAEAFKSLPEGLGVEGLVFYAELQTFLAGNLLEYTDKTTMAVALETRVPFLDHRLVELSARIPFHDKIQWGQSKAILKETFRDLIPPPIAQAPKRGFSPPIGRWMETVLDRYFDRVLTRPTVERDGLFQWEAIQRLRAEHRMRRRDASMDLLGIIMFDVWFRQYILGSQPVGEVA